MRDDELDKVLAAPLTIIKDRSTATPCAEVGRFGRGTTGIWMEQPERFWWGDAPKIDEFIEPDRSKAPLEKKLLRKPWEDQVEKERAGYQLVAETKQSAHRARVEKEFDRMRAYLAETATVPAPCTRFGDLAARVIAEDLPRTIILTDGWVDCKEDLDAVYAANDAQGMTGRLLIILLPRKGDSGSEVEIYNQRARRMKQLFPNAKVVPAYLAGRGIEELLQ
jgi:hypothetical protein